MIAYGATAGEPNWRMFFQRKGSVFPKCLAIVLPISVSAVVLKILNQQEVFGSGEDDWLTGFYFLDDGSPWGGFSGFVVFVIVFRLSQAYTTYWAAYSTTNSLLGDWSGAAASAVAFCRNTGKDEEAVSTFLQTTVRLFSMLSACALQELSPRKSHRVWGLLTLNASSIDPKFIRILDGSTMRVDLCYHWIQQLIVDSQCSGLLAAPAPIVGRILAELSSGMGKFGDAKKHATCQFNFPYAQTCKWLLVLYSILMPMMMVRWSTWVSGAFIFTFVQLFFIWTLESITIILENPFDQSNPNCIDIYQLQLSMNDALLLLMHPETRAGPPSLILDSSPDASVFDIPEAKFQTYEKLQKRDTVHKAALKHEGWKLKALKGPGTTSEAQVKRRCGGCCSCCRGPADLNAPIEMAISDKYCNKERYGIIDDEKVAVIPIGIFENEVIVVVPPSCSKRPGHDFMITVESDEGRNCQVAVKRIAVRDRHKLHKLEKDTPKAEYINFPYKYKPLKEVVFDALSRKKITERISTVKLPSELKAEKKIKELKEADQDGHGIDQITKLKVETEFCAALIKIGLDEDEAANEWKRRKDHPGDYEHDQDDRGYMIELDVSAFMMEREKKRREELQKRETEEANQKNIADARATGKIDALEKAIKKAELETDKDWASERNILEEWLKAENALNDAIHIYLNDADARKKEDALEIALRNAEKAGLKNNSCVDAKKKLEGLIVAKHEQRVVDAMGTGQIDFLKAEIEQAERDGISEESLTAARQKVQSWEEAETLLSEASKSKDWPKLKEAVDVAVSRGLEKNISVEIARQVLALEAAKTAGRVHKLQAALLEAEQKAVLAEDLLNDARQLLCEQEAAEKELNEALNKANPQQLEEALARARDANLHDDVLAPAREALEAAKASESAKASDTALNVSKAHANASDTAHEVLEAPSLRDAAAPDSTQKVQEAPLESDAKPSDTAHRILEAPLTSENTATAGDVVLLPGVLDSSADEPPKLL